MDLELLFKVIVFHYRAGLQSTPVEDLRIPNKYVGLSEYSFSFISLRMVVKVMDS